MSNSLYAEAITEAKQLKEAAEENAKQAIIDAMAPQIRSMIERELVGEHSQHETSDLMSEIFGLEEDLTENDEIEIDEALLSGLTDQAGSLSVESVKAQFLSLAENFISTAKVYNRLENKKDDDYSKFEIIAANLMREAKTLRGDLIRIVEGEESAYAASSLVDKIDDMLKEMQKMSTRSNDDVLYELNLSELNLFEEDEDEGGEAEDADIDLDAPEGGDEEGGDEDLGDEDLEGDEGPIELSLDPEVAEELLAALEAELGGEGEELEEPEGDEGEDLGEPDDEVEEYAEYAEADEAEEGDARELEEGDEWIEIDEGMLRREIARMRLSEGETGFDTMGDASAAAASFGGAKKSSGGKGQAQSVGDAKKGASSFGGGSAGKDAFTNPPKLNVYAENRQLRVTARKASRKNRELKGQLVEALRAVKGLRTQLTEMNLFNAKLLYANKLLQNKNISTRQMRSIVESLDKARSLREVKLLYKTLTESMTTSKSKSGSLTESTVRRTVGSSSRATRSASSSPANTEVDRWAVLAGINNK